MDDIFHRDMKTISLEDSIDTSYDFFQSQIIRHSVERPPKR